MFRRGFDRFDYNFDYPDPSTPDSFSWDNLTELPDPPPSSNDTMTFSNDLLPCSMDLLPPPSSNDLLPSNDMTSSMDFLPPSPNDLLPPSNDMLPSSNDLLPSLYEFDDESIVILHPDPEDYNYISKTYFDGRKNHTKTLKYNSTKVFEKCNNDIKPPTSNDLVSSSNDASIVTLHPDHPECHYKTYFDGRKNHTKTFKYNSSRNFNKYNDIRLPPSNDFNDEFMVTLHPNHPEYHYKTYFDERKNYTKTFKYNSSRNFSKYNDIRRVKAAAEFGNYLPFKQTPYQWYY